MKILKAYKYLDISIVSNTAIAGATIMRDINPDYLWLCTKCGFVSIVFHVEGCDCADGKLEWLTCHFKKLANHPKFIKDRGGAWLTKEELMELLL